MSTVDIESDADDDGANGIVIANGWHVPGSLNIQLEKYLKEEREKRKRSRYQGRSWRWKALQWVMDDPFGTEWDPRRSQSRGVPVPQARDGRMPTAQTRSTSRWQGETPAKPGLNP